LNSVSDNCTGMGVVAGFLTGMGMMEWPYLKLSESCCGNVIFSHYKALTRLAKLATTYYPAVIRSHNKDHGTTILIRQVKYLNNIMEQDHRAVKRVTRPMLGFKAYEATQSTRIGIELIHMIKKRQLVVEDGAEDLTAAEQFYSLAA
jgi:hypothetical protein